LAQSLPLQSQPVKTFLIPVTQQSEPILDQHSGSDNYDVSDLKPDWLYHYSMSQAALLLRHQQIASS